MADDDNSGFTHWAKEVKYKFCGEDICLVQDPSSHVLGSTVWDSAKCFMMFLEKNVCDFDAELMAKKRKKPCVSVCELGAGLGLAGIALAKRGFHVVVTDLAPVLPWLKENVELNFTAAERQRVVVVEYAWGTPTTALEGVVNHAPPFDIILCADVLYEAACVKPLVKSILALSTRKTIVYIANERRAPAIREEFMKYLNAYFVWKHVPQEDLHQDYIKDSMEVFEARRKHTKTPVPMQILDTDEVGPQDGLLHCEYNS
ncbi:Aste57867_24615 [Aphanomyces stellatus]|uniref:Aste57867_24615 protein n=1 Tax=Aphanomyces stellatus TaxID=120398 RepID=A0A485LQV1_9STRA|nr:hypothetical protein As57867_024537 [Aphanomyces stellatus]VFU01253.1 Aste57867_24615 [Aphanomyces stellatus]